VPALALAAGLIAIIPERPHGNRIIDGLAQNGVLQVGRAFFSAHLDYEHFYRVPPKDSGERDAAAWLGLQVPTPGAPPRKQIGTVSSRNPYDVLVILEESLGAEFVGGLGSSNACTPQLDRWSQQGLLLTNLSPRSVPDSRPGVDGPAPHSALLASRSRADAALARGAHR
jgi:hypothetical protein